MRVQVITLPATEPLSLSEVKDQVNVVNSAWDSLLTSIGVAARNHIEDRCGRALITQTWRITLDGFPDPHFAQNGAIELPGGRAQSITNVKYLDVTGAQQTLASDLYKADLSGEVARIVPAYGQQWPQTQDTIASATVDYVVGYGNAAAVPDGLKSAMRLMVGEMFANREINVPSRLTENTTIEVLIFPYRLLSP